MQTVKTARLCAGCRGSKHRSSKGPALGHSPVGRRSSTHMLAGQCPRCQDRSPRRSSGAVKAGTGLLRPGQGRRVQRQVSLGQGDVCPESKRARGGAAALRDPVQQCLGGHMPPPTGLPGQRPPALSHPSGPSSPLTSHMCI